MSFPSTSTMRWFVKPAVSRALAICLLTAAVALLVALFVATASGQEAPTATQQQTQQAPAAGAPQQQPAREATALANPDVKTLLDEATADTPAGELAIRNHKDRLSYAFGVDLARDLKRQKDGINLSLLIRAFADTLGDKPLLMTDAEVAATVKQAEAEQKQDFEHIKMMVSKRNKDAGEAFFAENLKKEGVVTLPSGLQYKILKKGEGKTPALDDKVVVQYKETLLDGIEIDSSEKHGQSVTTSVKGLMPGLTQALQMMPVGSKWQLFLPPQLGYGEKIVNGVGPNSTLIFEVEVLSIDDKPQTAAAK